MLSDSARAGGSTCTCSDSDAAPEELLAVEMPGEAAVVWLPVPRIVTEAGISAGLGMDRGGGVVSGEGRGPDLEIGLGIVRMKGTVRGLGRVPPEEWCPAHQW